MKSCFGTLGFTPPFVVPVERVKLCVPLRAVCLVQEKAGQDVRDDGQITYVHHIWVDSLGSQTFGVSVEKL